MVVIATTLVGNALATLVGGAVVMAVVRVVCFAVLAYVDVVKGGVNVGLMVATLAGEGNDIACCKYRSIQHEHCKCRKYLKRLVSHLYSILVILAFLSATNIHKI